MGDLRGLEAELICSRMACRLHVQSFPVKVEGVDCVPDGREVRSSGDIAQPKEAAHFVPPPVFGSHGQIVLGRRRHCYQDLGRYCTVKVEG